MLIYHPRVTDDDSIVSRVLELAVKASNHEVPFRRGHAPGGLIFCPCAQLQLCFLRNCPAGVQITIGVPQIARCEGWLSTKHRPKSGYQRAGNIGGLLAGFGWL